MHGSRVVPDSSPGVDVLGTALVLVVGHERRYFQTRGSGRCRWEVETVPLHEMIGIVCDEMPCP